jgi:polygalacturonase
MSNFERRLFLKHAGTGLAVTVLGLRAQQGFAQSTGGNGRGMIDVRTFGAAGDGQTIDSPAINKAIDAMSASGGGTLFFPAGNYLCYSIRLKSNTAFYLDQGATIVAADSPAPGGSAASGEAYDPAEPNEWNQYQDYGHSHWHNSLIWAEGAENLAITGPGRIWGKGLSKGVGPGPRAEQPGVGNKSIALKNCHNVLLRDFSMLHGVILRYWRPAPITLPSTISKSIPIATAWISIVAAMSAFPTAT